MANATYWLYKRPDGFYELRQNRYREQFCRGKEPPNDVCAVANNVEQMREMVKLLKGTVDWNEHG